MKRSTGLVLFCVVLFLTGASKAADDAYGGFHITVPFTFDAVGVHAVFRDNYGEVRAGIDTRGVWQLGAGFSFGESDSVVGSAGLAYSSYQGAAVGYAGLRGGDGRYEYGVVSYGADFATTYGLVGAKLNWDDDNDGPAPAPARTVNRPDDKVVNTDEGNNDGDSNSGNNPDPVGDSGSGDVGSGDTGSGDTDGGTGSGGDTGSDNGSGGSTGGDDRSNNGGGDNRSGLGDGTNPGKGKGRDHSPNNGTDNPNRAR